MNIPHSVSPAHRFQSTWLPTAFLLCAICAESTRTAGATHTLRVLSAVLSHLHLTAYCPDLNLTNVLLRKLGHFCGYGLLGLFSAQVWLSLFLHRGRRRWHRAARRAAALGIATAAVVATLDEWHQRYLPGRNSSALDVLLDTTGAAVFASLFLLVGYLNRRPARVEATQPAFTR